MGARVARLFGVIAAMIGAITAAGPATALDKVTFGTNWKAEAEHGGYYQAVADGTIDVIGTDHAPHPRQDKECEWSGAAHGMTGLETALSIAQHTLVDTGLLTWADVARVLSETPARIGGLEEQGRPLAEGEPANIVLFDPAAETVVDPEAHASKGRNSPFRGLSLPGAVRATLLRGHPVVLDSQLSSPHPDAARTVGGPYQGR